MNQLDFAKKLAELANAATAQDNTGVNRPLIEAIKLIAQWHADDSENATASYMF